MTIGILTSGGDAPAMNAVIAGACRELERSGRTALGVRDGFPGMAGRLAEPGKGRSVSDRPAGRPRR